MQVKIEKLAQQVCDDLDFFLVEIRIRGDRRQPIFEIFADTEKGITLKECETLTRELQDRIDMAGDFTENYRLNISSPGLDRPLVKDYEFIRNMGQQLIIRFQSAENIIEKTGELAGVDDTSLQLLISGTLVTICRADIKEAKVKTKW